MLTPPGGHFDTFSWDFKAQYVNFAARGGSLWINRFVVFIVKLPSLQKRIRPPGLEGASLTNDALEYKSIAANKAHFTDKRLNSSQ